jgi:catechol 2,3-dioxygenase-like lactoylglutathione lyase family enzyme
MTSALLKKEVDMPKVAHVVLAVRDPHVSAAFYTDVIGMQRVWDFDKLDMVFFSFGDRDHDIALIKAPAGAPSGIRALVMWLLRLQEARTNYDSYIVAYSTMAATLS